MEISIIQDVNLTNYSCNHCKRVFKFQNNMYRHKKLCNSSNNSQSLVKIQQASNVHGTIPQIVTNNNTTNHQTATTINNGTINNGTINIHINAVGNENIDYILSQHNFHGFAKGLVAGKRDGIAKLFTLKHLNDSHPENQNLRKKRERTQFIECFTEGEWTTRCYKDAMTGIMQNLTKDFENIIQKVFDEEGRINRNELNDFMTEVGEPLNMDFTGDDYDWDYNMTTSEKDAKRNGIYLFILEILYVKTRSQFIKRDLSKSTAETPIE